MASSHDDGETFLGFAFSLVKKRKTSKTRRLPFLPRFGIYVDVAGYELILKKVPLLEAVAFVAQAQGRVMSLGKVIAEQLAEVEFPKRRHLQVVNTSARTISVVPRDDAKR